jgi:hypothetical protein
MNYIYFFLIIFLIVLFFIICSRQNIEKFSFQHTLNQWERPFNSHNEGYYNAEPNKIPPLVYLYDYVDRKNVEFS